MRVDQLPSAPLRRLYLRPLAVCRGNQFGVPFAPPRRSCVLRPTSVRAHASFAMLQVPHTGAARRISLETFSKKEFAAAGSRAKRPLGGGWQCRRALATAGGLAGALLFSEAVVRVPEGAEWGMAARL